MFDSECVVCAHRSVMYTHLQRPSKKARCLVASHVAFLHGHSSLIELGHILAAREPQRPFCLCAPQCWNYRCIYFYICEGLPARIHHVYASCTWRQEGSFWSSGTRVTDDIKLPSWCWDPLEEHLVLLTTEPFLQPPNKSFLKRQAASSGARL